MRVSISRPSSITILVLAVSLAAAGMLLNNGIMASKETMISVHIIQNTTLREPNKPTVNYNSSNTDQGSPDGRDPYLAQMDEIIKHLANFTLVVEVPDGSGSSKPETGNHTYIQGTSFRVEATPAPNWVFSHWLLDDSTQLSNPVTVVMNTTHRLRPVFKPILYTLTISISGSGSTNPASGTHTYINGTRVLLNATAPKGWKFNYWTLGDEIWDENPTSVVITKDLTILATFTPLVLPVSTSSILTPPVTREPPFEW